MFLVTTRTWNRRATPDGPMTRYGGVPIVSGVTLATTRSGWSGTVMAWAGWLSTPDPVIAASAAATAKR
ncbi:hypothetical protein acdb102_32160 [Acidothermaceae bacterium B102]|nr:hypothetical protein acdb102_32160 [Acidothermaceae bacterium B102]